MINSTARGADRRLRRVLELKYFSSLVLVPRPQAKQNIAQQFIPAANEIALFHSLTTHQSTWFGGINTPLSVIEAIPLIHRFIDKHGDTWLTCSLSPIRTYTSSNAKLESRQSGNPTISRPSPPPGTTDRNWTLIGLAGETTCHHHQQGPLVVRRANRCRRAVTILRRPSLPESTH